MTKIDITPAQSLALMRNSKQEDAAEPSNAIVRPAQSPERTKLDARIHRALKKMQNTPAFLDVWRGAHFVYQMDLRFHYIGRKAERDAEKRARLAIEAAPASSASSQTASPAATQSPASLFSDLAPFSSLVSSYSQSSVSSGCSDEYTSVPIKVATPAPRRRLVYVEYDGESSSSELSGEPATPATRKLSVADLQPIKLLGAGSYGQVYLAKDRLTGKELAVKVTDKVFLEEQQVLRELAGHSCFLQLHASWRDQDHCYFATEYHPNGDLQSELDRWRKIPELYAKFIAAEMMVTLDSLHALGMVHRDVKPENVLFDSEGHVVLADFGIATHLADPSAPAPADGTTPSCFTNSSCGTLDYMAPEMINGEAYAFDVDFWALGVMLYQMLTGRLPFGVGFSEYPPIVMAAILVHDVRFEESDHVSPEAQDLIRSMLRKKPEDRLSDQDIVAHKFFADVDWNAMADRAVKPPSVPPPYRVRSDGEGLVIPSGTPFARGEDRLPEFTYISPILLDSPLILFELSTPSITTAIPNTSTSSTVSTPSGDSEKPPKASKFVGIRDFLRRNFKRSEKAKPFSDPSLGVITKTVTSTVETSPAPSSKPEPFRRPSTRMDPRRPGFPILTAWNTLAPMEELTPMPRLGTNESWRPMPRIRESMLPRPSSLYLRVRQYDIDQERLLANPPPPPPKFSEKVRVWWSKMKNVRGSAKNAC